MPNRFIPTDASLLDIQGHRNYLLDIASSEIAHDFVTSTFDKFQLLADFPNIGKPRPEIKSGYYSFPDTKYKRTIFYCKVLSGIRILAVLGSYQDHKRHLKTREAK